MQDSSMAVKQQVERTAISPVQTDRLVDVVRTSIKEGYAFVVV
jgi:hypothetical protein